MYNVYVKKQGAYSADLVGEYSDINEAIKLANDLKEKDSSITYTIEEVGGHFDSYGEPISTVIKKG